ncbi:hypothetical protein [Mesorhizobium sp. Mes31]|nr:hypothetical protein [Mesorhizobium sp. Mes31]
MALIYLDYNTSAPIDPAVAAASSKADGMSPTRATASGLVRWADTSPA